jgi:hypothetical protein
LKNNTVVRYNTHMVMAVPLLEQAREEYGLQTHDWFQPTEYYLGTPKEDEYYAEVWSNELYHAPTYWVIESIKWEDPVAIPLALFEDDKPILSEYDLSMLIRGCLWYRRFHKGDRFNDSLWPYITKLGSVCPHTKALQKYAFKISKEPTVEFYLNSEFSPK